MKNVNEKLAGELLDAIEKATAACNVLAITTGDQDFSLLSIMLKAAVAAKAKGDIDELMQLVAGFIDKKIMAGRDALVDVIDDPRFTPSLN
jgi:hypothetical protein